MGRNAFGQLYRYPWGRPSGRLTHRLLELIERRAMRGGGAVARAAVRYLSRAMITGNFYPDAQPVLRVLYGARDPRVREQARDGLERAWAAGTTARANAWLGIWQLAASREHPHGQWFRLAGPLPAAARDFLLVADPAAHHEPKLRLVAAFDQDDVAWTSDAELVVEAAVGHGDRLLADVLARTDQPQLVTAIEAAFLRSLRSADHPLWTNEPLLAVLRSSPVIPRPPAEARDRTVGALVAVVMDRLDLLDDSNAWELFLATDEVLRRDPPADVAERLRWVLHRPGPMAEVIRGSAMNGNDVALAVWRETGGHTTDPHWRAAHLFWTRDWPAYDALDADGRLLREFLLRPPSSDPRITGTVQIARQFRAIAAEEGRPDPLPPPPPGTGSEPTGTRFSGGSWPTSFTGHF